MGETSVLLDPATGLHVAWYFWLRVLDEVNRSTRYGHPFALLLLEAIPTPGGSGRSADEAVGRVPRAIRSTDLGGLLGPGRVGVLLPYQDVASARTARARLVGRLLEGPSRGVAWRDTLLCYPADGAAISNLLTGDDRRPTLESA